MDPTRFLQQPGPIQFAQPEFWQLLWLLPIVLLLLCLRQRAQRFAVPHLVFLQRALARVGQRGKSLYPWMQGAFFLLSFGLIVTFLVGPYRLENKAREDHWVLVLDQSLGTRALDLRGQTLWSAVCAKARELQAAAPGSVAVAILQGALVPIASGAEVRPELFERLAEATPRGARNFDAVLDLAESLPLTTRVKLITPFAPTAATQARMEALQIDVYAIPGVRENSSILAARIEPSLRLVLEVSAPAGARQVRVWSGPKEQRILVGRVDLDPFAATQRVEVALAAPAGQMLGPILEAQLIPGDAFEDDDRVWLHLAPDRPRVLLLDGGPGQAVLEAFAAASNAIGGVMAWNPEAPEPLPAGIRPIRVSTRSDSRDPWPPGPTLAFATSAFNTPYRFPRGEFLAPSEVLRVKAEDPLLRALEFDEWVVSAGRTLIPSEGFEPLIEGSAGPLVGRFSRGGLRGFAFATSLDAAAGSLSQLEAFPILLDGMVRELWPDAESRAAEVLPAGGVLSLLGHELPFLFGQAGERFDLEPLADGTGYRLPEAVGVFSVAGPESPRTLSLAWFAHPGCPSAPATDRIAEPAQRSVRVSARPLLAILLIGLLLVQWWHRHFG